MTYSADELESKDSGLVLSEVVGLTKLSTLSKPLALLRMLFVDGSGAGVEAGCLD